MSLLLSVFHAESLLVKPLNAHILSSYSLLFYLLLQSSDVCPKTYCCIAFMLLYVS